jgi:hypothetical protein
LYLVSDEMLPVVGEGMDLFLVRMCNFHVWVSLLCVLRPLQINHLKAEFVLHDV